MRPSALVRLSTVAHLTFLVLLVVGMLGFSYLVITNTAPTFSRELVLSSQSALEIHNGSACPRGMTMSVCYWTGQAFQRQFRVVYRTPHYLNVLVSIRLPNR